MNDSSIPEMEMDWDLDGEGETKSEEERQLPNILVGGSSPTENEQAQTSKSRKLESKKKSKKYVWDSGRPISGLINRNFEVHIKSSKHRNRFPEDFKELTQKKNELRNKNPRVKKPTSVID